MTDAPEKPQACLAPEAFVAKLRKRRQSFDERREVALRAALERAEARIDGKETAYELALLDRVDPAYRDAAVAMAESVGLHLVAPKAEQPAAEERPAWLEEQPPPANAVEVDRATGKARRVQ